MIRGHAGLADGPLDAAGAQEAALALARERGTAVPEGTRLADSDLWLVPEGDDAGGPDRILPGFGNTMRDGLGVRAERGGVEIAIVGGLVADPCSACAHEPRRPRRAHRRHRPGGNPDTMDGSRWCSTRPPP